MTRLFPKTLFPSQPDHLELDPREAERKKTQRDYRLHVIQIPTVRLVGLTIIALCVLPHNLFIVRSFSWPTFVQVAAILEGYALGSWLLLYLCFRRVKRFNLGDLFLVVDVFILTLTTYLTGGERSWGFLLLIMHTASQANTTFRRALGFGHVSVLSYGLLVGYLTFVEQRSISWAVELSKLAFLYGANLYISLIALTAQRLRERTTAAIRVARELILQLEEKSQQLEEAGRVKSQFLANMSHELRTPLNSIIGFSKVLLNRLYGDLTERQEAHIQSVYHSSTHLLHLINDVLDLARVEASKMEVSVEPVDLRRLVEECVASSTPLVRGKPVTIETDIPVDGARGYGDPVKVRQVLLNLLSNAIKFTPKGLVVVRVRPRPDAVQVSVADTGIGIREEDLPQVFEPFHRLSNQVAREAGGTGLGLAISKRFVEMQGGSIWAESREKQGSTFHFTLPLVPLQ